jgi:RimJ/RimL family protein N-acetyltransferase
LIEGILLLCSHCFLFITIKSNTSCYRFTRNVTYVTEAHKLILDYGFDELGLLVVFSQFGCDNEVLKQALVSIGFVYEGTLRKFGRDMSDRMRYSLIKDEYRLL